MHASPPDAASSSPPAQLLFVCLFLRNPPSCSTSCLLRVVGWVVLRDVACPARKKKPLTCRAWADSYSRGRLRHSYAMPGVARSGRAFSGRCIWAVLEFVFCDADLALANAVLSCVETRESKPGRHDLLIPTIKNLQA
jgi:hypothetical protein